MDHKSVNPDAWSQPLPSPLSRHPTSSAIATFAFLGLGVALGIIASNVYLVFFARDHAAAFEMNAVIAFYGVQAVGCGGIGIVAGIYAGEGARRTRARWGVPLGAAVIGLVATLVRIAIVQS